MSGQKGVEVSRDALTMSSSPGSSSYDCRGVAVGGGGGGGVWRGNNDDRKGAAGPTVLRREREKVRNWMGKSYKWMADMGKDKY